LKPRKSFIGFYSQLLKLRLQLWWSHLHFRSSFLSLLTHQWAMATSRYSSSSIFLKAQYCYQVSINVTHSLQRCSSFCDSSSRSNHLWRNQFLTCVIQKLEYLRNEWECYEIENIIFIHFERPYKWA